MKILIIFLLFLTTNHSPTSAQTSKEYESFNWIAFPVDSVLSYCDSQQKLEKKTGKFSVVLVDTFTWNIKNITQKLEQNIKLGEIVNVYETKIGDVVYIMSFWTATLNKKQEIKFILIMEDTSKNIHAVGTKIGDDTMLYYLRNEEKYRTTTM